MAMSVANDRYYDIMLLGRTGRGKSTTGNQLLEEGHGRLEEKCFDKVLKAGNESENSKLSFLTGDGVDSITSACRIISNEFTKVRILDTPGFADSKATKTDGVMKANLQIVRSVFRCAGENSLAFRRVLYFLPQRGPLERADGTMQEELKVIHGYFGNDIFKVMVIVATCHKRMQIPAFEEEDIKRTQEAFMISMKAIKNTTGECVLDKCPPILYIRYNETNILEKIKKESVLDDNPFTPKLVHNRCIKCSTKIIHAKPCNGLSEPVKVVINEGGTNQHTIAYRDSKCHPDFVSRYSTATKAIGGVAHIATAGVLLAAGKLRGRKFWPGFTNDEEMCINCNRPPVGEACWRIDSIYTTPAKRVTHSYSCMYFN